jgi:hypothetical protein
MDTAQIQFLKYELFNAAWNASTQRNSIYKNGTDSKNKARFKKIILDEIMFNVITKYGSKVSEAEHVENIKRLKMFAQRKAKECSIEASYNIGTAQKLLNVVLKFYWTAGFIVEPPHCPIDSIILKKLKLNKTKWTKIADIRVYKKIIKAINEIKGDRTIAVWELEEYNQEIMS